MAFLEENKKPITILTTFIILATLAVIQSLNNSMAARMWMIATFAIAIIITLFGK